MFFLSVFGRLMLAAVLLALSNETQSAPTHHLTIGVQGNTPTLMVTSSEIGITARTLNFNNKPAKLAYATKISKNSEKPNEFSKLKFAKNQEYNNKKGKLQYLTKSASKNEFKADTLNKEAKILEHKQNETLQTTAAATVAISTSPKSVEIFETNLQSTNLPPKQINETPLILSITRTTTTKSPEEISTLLSSATANTSSTHFVTTDNDNLNISPVASTTLSPKEFSTLNNNDDTATTRHTLLTQTSAVANDVVLQTQKTTQISTETSIIKMANKDSDNDRYIQEPNAVTDNENLLLTSTIETNTFTTPTTTAEVATPSTVSLKLNNTEPTTTTDMLALSLIMTTTENLTDDNSNGYSGEDEQQQQQQEPAVAAEKAGKDINGRVKSIKKDGRVKEAGKQIKREYENDPYILEPTHQFASPTSKPQQLMDEIKPIANTYQKENVQTTQQTIQNNIPTPLSKQEEMPAENEPQTSVDPKLKYQTPSIATEAPELTVVATNASTTERIIKLIDLEKHALKRIDELKQPSLLRTAQYDKGHDGVKTIKKKQLIDKHYVEALLHHEQDPQQRVEPQEPNTANLSKISTKATLAGQTIEHGSLGPILMQEKTFHVQHKNENAKKLKQHLQKDINSYLRRGHFVELKAKSAVDEDKSIDEIVLNKDMKIVPIGEKEIMEMQSDQPAENFNPLSVATTGSTKTAKQVIKSLKDLTRSYKQNTLKNATNKIARKFGQNENHDLKENPTQQAHYALDSSNATTDLKTNSNKDDKNSKDEKHVEKSLEISNNQLKPTLNQKQQELVTESLHKKSTHEDDNKFEPEKVIKANKKWSRLTKTLETKDISDFELQPPNDDEHQEMIIETVKNKNLKEQKNIQEPLELQSTIKSFEAPSEDIKELSVFGLRKQVYIPPKSVGLTAVVTNSSRESNKNLNKTEIISQTLDSKPLKKYADTLSVTSALQSTEKHQKTEMKNNFESTFTKNQAFDKHLNDTYTIETRIINHKAASRDTTEQHLETLKASGNERQDASLKTNKLTKQLTKPASVLSTTVFQVMDTMATKTPFLQADTLFSAHDADNIQSTVDGRADKQQTESRISDIQIEVYDSTIDSIVASTNFKDNESNQNISVQQDDETYLGKTTKPPIAAIQQERFTQYVIDRTETSTPEPINYNTVKVASGKPEPAAIEIHINVSESIGNESEDLEFSYPQTEFRSNQQNDKNTEESYDVDNKASENIKLQIPSNSNNNAKDLGNEEILVVEIIDTENNTAENSLKKKSKIADELFISDVKHIFATPPPPPPPPPFQTNFDRDSDTIFYISNTEVKVGESLSSNKNINEDRKLKLESQFFPANYMTSTHPNLSNNDDKILNGNHHLYEEDIILSSNHNQADSLKIYRNENEPSPPLDVTYVGESIIEVEQSPDTVVTTTYAPDQIHNMATQQADVIIQPALLPEISIGVPVIGELPPQIELKEIDFMPNEAQLHRSGIYDDNDNNNNNNNINGIDDNTITGSSNNNNKNKNNNNNNHDVDADVDVDVVSGNSNQHTDESSIQYGGDLIDESADGGFDGVEGSYPFGNPALVKKPFTSSSFTSNFFTKSQKQQQQQQQHQQQQPNHVADYAHLYVNYGVNNMRKDELTADVKDSGEMFLSGNVGNGDGNGNANIASKEQNTTSFKDFLNKTSMSNATVLFAPVNATQNERMSNATAFSVMEDVNELEDRNTENIINLISLAIGLFIVILPIVVTCSMFWALRYLYKKYHSNLMDNAEYADQHERKIPLDGNGAEKGEFVHEPSSSTTNSHKDTLEKYPDMSNKPSTIYSNVKFSSEKPTPTKETSSSNTNASLAANYASAIAFKKNEASKLSLTLTSPITQKQAKPLSTASSPPSKPTTSAHTHYEHDDEIVSEARDDDDVEMPGPNGSITKMTLENNLLIVETEERNDISRVARETKMDYNKDGVFVVEVARGIDSKTMPESPVAEENEKKHLMFDTKQNNGGLGYKTANEKSFSNNEKVQIHSPPPENQEEGPRSLHQIEEVDEPINSPHLNESNEEAFKSNTGLSQSDLSTTSSSDSNKRYCYGNQELYVVEQKGYSTVAPNDSVVLRCDLKDIKDDDRNPGNDHYLKHSPDKKEELNNDKEDAVEASKKSQEKESRTNSGESPEQKQNEKIQGKKETDNVSETATEILTKRVSILSPFEEKSVENSRCVLENEVRTDNKVSGNLISQSQDVSIAVEIEVHAVPVSTENLLDDYTSPSHQASAVVKSGIVEEIESVPQPLTPETVQEIVTDVLNEAVMHKITPQEDQNLDDNCIPTEPELLMEAVETPDEGASPEVISSFENDTEEKKFENSNKDASITENLAEKSTDDQLKKKLKIIDEAAGEEENPETSTNLLETNGFSESKRSQLETNGVMKSKETFDNEEFVDEMERCVDHGGEETIRAENPCNGQIEPDMIKSSLNGFAEPESKEQHLQNGYADQDGVAPSCACELKLISKNEMENGYDSILNLPEPPPTTDEQLISDLSEQQLDSLPPPPPPEIFNLKDLPPPLTNGNVDFPQSEQSNCFYNTLPPPPPTTLAVTVSARTATTTNGKVHASPLTPPASPPTHFTNNLHAELCSQAIAVDVNGS